MSSSPRKERILIVDDSTTTLEVLQRNLTAAGYQVCTAPGVDEAIETVARIKEIDRAYCRRHVERHFTVDRMINEYIQVYEMILSDRPL